MTIELTADQFSVLFKHATAKPLTPEARQELKEVCWSVLRRVDPEAAAKLEKAPATEPTMTPEEAGAYIEKMNPPSEEAKALYEAIAHKYGPDATFGDVLAPELDSN